ncbi:LETM1 domain-containing protein 1 [Rhodnius prolixus]|uniref:Putative receptor ccr1 panstrongylus lignarius n=2 Tax=Rhodnius TaxID=13248 RepID=A0A4P6D8D7_RHOPR
MFFTPRLAVTVCKRNLFGINALRKSHGQSSNRSSGPFSPLRKYVFSSYVEYIKNYEVQLEKTFPSAIRIYRVFKIGVQDLYKDIKLFLGIIKKLNANKRNLECLTRKELEIYFQMPKDMYRVAPVLLISALPFANYIIFPLAYLFPRQLLSSHFWSLQQRVQFAVLDQKSRLRYYKPVFRSLQARLKQVKANLLYFSWRRCIALLGSGLHPSSAKILRCQPLFGKGQIYHMKNLTTHHIGSLLRMHNMHPGWRRRKRLLDRAKLIHLMDLAIVKEGGVEKLTNDEIRAACFIRGLNPTNMNTEETVVWLNEWVNISSNLREDHWSFILHLPILMAYNHPSNWVLIH